MGVTTSSETIFRGFAATPSFPGAPSLRLVIMRLPSVSKAEVNNSEYSFGGGMYVYPLLDLEFWRLM